MLFIVVILKFLDIGKYNLFSLLTFLLIFI